MLEVRAITKTYEGKPLLRGISLKVEAGETICLLGASGSGKSTLLRIIAGLEEAEGGQILWDGVDQAPIPVHQRGFGLMFQDYALFPHRTVAENVAFGLKMQGISGPPAERRVGEALEKVHMSGFAQRRVTDLSGGEQQRVALARALVPQPRLLMLDEPLGALDRGLREQLLEELRRVLAETAIPAIYVTHDQEEGFAIADRLALLREGRVVQTGAPPEVYRYPADAEAARFLGLTNLLAGEVAGLQPLTVRTSLGAFRAEADPRRSFTLGQRVQVLLRPLHAQLSPGADAAGAGQLDGRVVDVLFRPEGFRVTLDCAGQRLQFLLTQPVKAGETVSLSLPLGGVLCL